ncbi:MAG: lipoprotein-releasing ABC transporter permease subunit [Pseudomonadota bacterium]
MLAGRYLRARRKEGFISVIALLSLIGIALGVATLIIVMSVMNGFRAELVGKIVGVNGHFTVRTVAEPFRDFDAVAERVRAVPGVTRAAPLIEGQAFASTARNGLGVLVRGVRRSDLLTLENVAVTPEFSLGSLTNFEGDNGVALGQGLALRLGVTVGDTITLISPRGSVTPFGVVPKRRSFEVLYIFKVGMANYDAAVMFMPLEQAQTFFNRNDTVDAVELMVATPEDLSGYREEIAAAAGRSVDLDDWQRANQSLMGALKTERTVMFLILSLLIVIASLIIISGLIMLVKEKGPDIAILRTMGMSRGGVLRVFFMCGATIGVVGTTIGVALGLAFCLNIEAIQGLVEYLANGEVFPDDVYILSKLPAKLHLEDVGFAVGISLGLSFLATLYPAWRAARLDPVEALRYE